VAQPLSPCRIAPLPECRNETQAKAAGLSTGEKGVEQGLCGDDLH